MRRVAQYPSEDVLSTGMPEPTLVSLLFADRVITEENGKKAIIGTFNRFHSEKYPVLFPPWFIYAAVTNIEGEHDFSLKLVNESNDKEVVSFSGQLKAQSHMDVAEMIVQIVNAVFESQGLYTLDFRISDKLVGSRTLTVTEPIKEKEH